MPLGATPSRWCVCQFHHFRASNCFTFNQLLKTPGAFHQCIHYYHHFLHQLSLGKLPAPKSGQLGKKRTDHVRLRLDGTHSRLDGIVARLVLQRGRRSGAIARQFCPAGQKRHPSCLWRYAQDRRLPAAVTISVVKTCRWQPKMLRRSGCLHRLPCSAHS